MYCLFVHLHHSRISGVLANKALNCIVERQFEYLRCIAPKMGRNGDLFVLYERNPLLPLSICSMQQFRRPVAASRGE